MKKILRIAGCAVVAAMALAGCGGGDDDDDTLAGDWYFKRVTVTGQLNYGVDKEFLANLGYEINSLKLTFANDGTVSAVISRTDPGTGQPVLESTSIGQWNVQGDHLVISATGNIAGQPANMTITFDYTIADGRLTMSINGQDLVGAIPNYNALIQQAASSTGMSASMQVFITQLLGQMSQLNLSFIFERD